MNIGLLTCTCDLLGPVLKVKRDIINHPEEEREPFPRFSCPEFNHYDCGTLE